MEAEEEFLLEEGEVSDDSDNNYIPLQRPANYSATQSQPRFPTQKESESEEDSPSDSDSDSDPNIKRNKKPRIKFKPTNRSIQRPKKYDIWSTRVQEDVLSETLISCDVSTKDRSRAVESYDFTLAAKYNKNHDDFEDRKSNKRTSCERNNKNIRPNRRRSLSSENKSKLKGKARHIPALSVAVDSTNEEVAKEIASKLLEEKEDLILKVINVFGRQRTIAVFEETRRLEADGGLLIMNQTRRRTSGGVFLFLVRHDDNITADERDKIFMEDRNKDRLIAKQKNKMKLNRLKQEIDDKENSGMSL